MPLRIRAAACAVCCIIGAATALSGQESEWTVELSPLVSAGDGAGEGHQLLDVRDAALLADGSLIVLSAGTKDLRVYASNGSFIRAVGREGEGPGEFKFPTGFTVLPSGNLLVYDPGNLRVTEFDRDFEVVGTARVAYAIDAMTPAFGRQRPMYDGSIPVAAYETPFLEAVRRDEGVYQEDLVVRLFRGTDVQASVRRPRGAVYQARDGNTGVTLPLPMGEFALFNWGPEYVVLGSSHSNEFNLYDTSGVLVQTVRAQGAARPATRADMAAFDERVRSEIRAPVKIRGMRMPRSDVSVERFLKDAPRGDHVPLYEKVEISDAGRVWVREYVLHSDHATWQVLDPHRGGVIATVTIPASWEILRPGQSHIVVLQRDEYDVEVVRAYRVYR